MRNVNKQQTNPISVPRSNRNHQLSTLTSGPAGKVIPLAAIPLLREDAARGLVKVGVEMLETHELIANKTLVRFTVWVVPNLAYPRFEGSREQFDNSYAGRPQYEGGDVVPYMVTAAMGTHGSNAVYKALGLHGAPTDLVNTAFLEGYNLIDEFRRTNASEKLTPRLLTDKTLAPAFWNDSRFEHLVPSFDQAVIDGQFALRVVEGDLAVRLGTSGTSLPTVIKAGGGAQRMIAVSSGNPITSAADNVQRTTGAGLQTGGFAANLDPNGSLHADITNLKAHLAENSLTVSLSDIALARKTQWFAKLREKFQGHKDEYIIDMLMNGIRVPDEFYKQPFMIADTTEQFVQVKRHATDSGNLADSAVSGGARASFDIRVPALNTGGMIYILAECMPQQLWERQRDPWFHLDFDAETGLPILPEYLRDALDPEKVDVVKNAEIDTDHADPDGTFAYGPLNWKWNAFGPRVGGKFYRPAAGSPVDTARERLWAVEDEDPKYSENFILVEDLPTYVFLDEEAEPFEFMVAGNVVINGNTQFGGKLVEATDNYDKVMAKAPTARIDLGA